MSEENHIATTADFVAAQELQRKVERVRLPKLGKDVLMSRPTPLWFAFRGHLPQALASQVSGADVSPVAPEDAARLNAWILDIVEETMVQPKVSLHPGPGEISPHLIGDEDLAFIIKWAMGIVASDGSDLTPFRDERESTAPGASGRNVRLPS